MGICVKSQDYEFYTGYFTFNALRTEIAGLLGDEWREHYEAMIFAPYDMTWDEYNAKTDEMAKALTSDEELVLDFLYLPDVEASLDKDHCKALMTLMERTHSMWQADIRSWAYVVHDPFTLADFHTMLEDGYESGEGIHWC